MAVSERMAPGAVALLLAAAPVAAAPFDPPRRPETRVVVVHPRPASPPAPPLGFEVAPGLLFETPFTVVAGYPARVVRVPHYIGPDGSYDEHADLVRSINGTPCGQECTRRSLLRWGYVPDDRRADLPDRR